MKALTKIPPKVAVRPRRRSDETTVDWRGAVTTASRYASQLPQLVTGWAPAQPVGYEEGLLRLEAALWELAARQNVEVGTLCRIEDVADRLVVTAGLVPPARDAIRVLAPLLRRGADGLVEDVTIEVDALRTAARVVSYVELRARLG